MSFISQLIVCHLNVTHKIIDFCSTQFRVKVIEITFIKWRYNS